MSPRTSHTAKSIVFVVALLISAAGVFGIFVPAGLVWIAGHAATTGVFYLIAAVRVALGLLLISAASASRAPKTIRIVGYFVLIAGITTALIGLVAMERARAMIDWWLLQGTGVVRLTGVLVLALGSFLTYACAPARRAA